MNTDALLEKDCLHFSLPEIEGFIGYKLQQSQAVVFGDPVSAPQDKPRLAIAFDDYCQSKGIGTVYIMVSQEFTKWSVQNLSAVAIEFGEKFILDPQSNPLHKKGSKAGLVRKKVKHASAAGVVIEEYSGNDPHLERQIEEVASDWLKGRSGPQIYLSHLKLFEDRQGKRWFYARQGDRIIGFLLLNALSEKEGWLLNHVMIAKDTPNGLSELLIISTLQTLEKEHCRYVLVGPIPAHELGEIEGLGEGQATLVRWLFKGARLIFKLGGHAAFWDKFQPQSESCYLSFPHKNVRYSSIKALLTAINAGTG